MLSTGFLPDPCNKASCRRSGNYVLDVTATIYMVGWASLTAWPTKCSVCYVKYIIAEELDAVLYVSAAAPDPCACSVLPGLALTWFIWSSMAHLSCGNRPLARCPNQPGCGEGRFSPSRHNSIRRCRNPF